MADYEILHNGLSKAVWGYIFLTFDINLMTVSILPQFVGYLLLFSAVKQLAEERKDLLLLRPLCLLLAAYHLADWLLSWSGTGLDGRLLFLDLLAAAAGLYFQFQFLTDMAALAERVQDPGMLMDGSIRIRRNLYVVLMTVLHLLEYVLPLETESVTFQLLLIPACIVSLTVVYALASLRKLLENAPRVYWDER